MYIDDVALAMVVGGTIAIRIISAPWHLTKQMFESFAGIIFRKSPKTNKVIEECLHFVKQSRLKRWRDRKDNSRADSSRWTRTSPNFSPMMLKLSLKRDFTST